MHNIIHFYSCIYDEGSGHSAAVLADAPSLHHCEDPTVVDTAARR
ncbi:hypothetical protein [Corynebacterium sp. BF-R-2]|nr:hypothetical protein [Corynebacterium sp. BF-R-2]